MKIVILRKANSMIISGVKTMLKYVIKRICGLFAVLFGVSVLTFVLTTFIQGNPAEIALRRAGIEATLEDIAMMERQLGLDRTVPEQYFMWIGNALRLDFGESNITRRPVIQELALRLPATASLAIGAFALMFVLSVPIGILSVAFHGRWPDKIISAFSFVVMGIPGFVLGTVLLYFISVRLELLPMIGEITPARYILPVVTLALPMACRYIRIVKAGILDVLGEDYILLLRVQGLREATILYGNALKNAFIPILNLMGLSFGTLLGGAIVVETIFSWPGLGSYLMSSIAARDFPVLIAYILLMATAFVIINFLVDFIACLLDPRISLKEEARLR